MSNVEIVSQMQSLSDLLLNSYDVFEIPDFQRSYVWTEKEIKQMLLDFSEDTDNFSKESADLEGYLLGNIVLITKDNGRKKTVIDGQQRLTSISLIFKATEMICSNKIQEHPEDFQKWMSKISNLNRGYKILNDDDSFKSLRILHSPSLNFGEYYKRLIHNDLKDFEPSVSSDINMKNVFEQIQDFLSELTDDQLSKFIIYIKTKVKLIVTTAPNEAKAFQLFEVLNDRGRSLEPMDLIKNTFLKTLTNEGKTSSQLDNFNENWKKFIDNLIISNKKRISSSVFLKHYLIAFEGVNKKQDQLFQHFNNNEYKYSGDDILNLSKNLEKYSKIYSDIEKGNYDSFIKDNNMYILFDLLSVKQMHPLLMLFYFSEDDKKKEILDLATRFAASVLFSYTQTNFIEKEMGKLTVNYLKTNDKEAAFKNLKAQISDIIKDRAKMAKATIGVRDFTSGNGNFQAKSLQLLKFIELYFNKNPQIIKPQERKKITVEHILSRNIDLSDYNDAGFENQQDFKEHINRIGNFTLLYNTDNSSIGNKMFKDKIEMYKSSDFKMTNVIAEPLTTEVKSGMDTKLFNLINDLEKPYTPNENGHFSKLLIEQRSEEVANALYKILTKEYD